MFMGRDWKYWAGVAGMGALGMTYVVLQPDIYEEHTEVLMEQLHLPEGVEFEVLASDHSGKHSRENVEAIVQFTPGQYNTYIRSFEDRQLWALQYFEWDGVEVVSPSPERATTWWTGNEAFHDGTSFPHYLHWGHAMDDAPWDVEPKYSFCFAVVGEGNTQKIYQCGDLQEGRPEFYVRAMIDAEGQRLFAYIST